MKESISALMDGELRAGESARTLSALAGPSGDSETWRVYLLIGDAVRGEPCPALQISARVGERLAAESAAPVSEAVPARWTRFFDRSRWIPVFAAAAAGTAAAALVGWVAFSPDFGDPLRALPVAALPAVHVPEIASRTVAASQPAMVPLTSAANDYLIAHQAYSPRGSLQGVAPYVRSVAATSATR